MSSGRIQQRLPRIDAHGHLIPERYRTAGAWEDELRGTLGDLALTAVPIPHDCTDGFYGAFWRRPSAYLDPTVRAGISVFARLGADEVHDGLGRLAADLRSGLWRERHRDLEGREALHLGYYVAVAENRSGHAGDAGG